MIQRIQSFLLVLAAVGVVLMFMFPIATYSALSEQSNYVVSAELNLFPKSNPDMLKQIESGLDVQMEQAGHIHTWPLVVLALAVGVVSLVSIFLYRNRVVQMRVVMVGFLLNVVYVALLFLWAVDAYGHEFTTFATGIMGLDEPHTVYSAGTYIPFVTLVLLFFAQRAIKRDELKVRAADRLR